MSRLSNASDRVAREDLLLFVNACFACTGQREFYGDGRGQRVSLDFLHRYIAGNYRDLYAQVLALGVNHLNRALIVRNLLASGRDTRDTSRARENALLTRTLHTLPTHRAMHLLEDLAKHGVNNRRARALTKAYLERAKDRDFLAVKYRRSYRRAAVHAHVPFAGELGPFFLRGWKERSFRTPIFESFRRAHYSDKALYELPYSVAEGLAAKRGVRRETFLEKIAPRLTSHERMRLLSTREAMGLETDVDWSRQALVRIGSYFLSRSQVRTRTSEGTEARLAHEAEFAHALASSAGLAARRTKASYGRVVCVLDRSFSSYGSREKPLRPLAAALGVSRFFRATARDYTALWTSSSTSGLTADEELRLTPHGTTDLITPLLAALRLRPEMLVVVSDGYDNDPQGLAGQVLNAGARLLPGCFMLHLNPVYDSETYAPKSLTSAVPTLGLRDAEDVPTLIALARFAAQEGSMHELERELDVRVRAFLGEAA
jgi:hypothetical protein